MVTVVCTDGQKNELLLKEGETLFIDWQVEPVTGGNTTVYIDLLFDNSIERTNLLKNSSAKLIIVNHVGGTAGHLPPHFIRINGWPGFLNRAVMECVAADEESKPMAEELFSHFNKKIMWLPDTPGFVSARVIAMVINEAFYTLGENVSTKPDIDIAMKLGTNYPFGPFEWANKIGIKNIYTLLMEMGKTNPRYHPCGALIKEALQ